MAPRTIYAGLTDGLQPFSLFDQSLADMGNLGMIPCTASGTNAIVLTPFPTAFAPTITIPNQLQNFSFVAAASSTGSITIQVGTTTALKLYKEDGVTQAAANDLLINVLYGIVYNSALNGAAGGFQIVFPITSVINPVITGATISNSTITTSTYNGNTWTSGTGILTIAALKTLAANNSLTLAGTDGTTMTFPPISDTVVTLSAAQTLTNKTLTAPTLTGTTSATTIVAGGSVSATTADANFSAGGNRAFMDMASGVGRIGSLNGGGSATSLGIYANGVLAISISATNVTTIASLILNGSSSGNLTIAPQAVASGTISLPNGTDTLTGRATTDTLTNKTFDTAGVGNVFKINGVGITANTGTGSNVLATSPSLTTPNIGAATATTVVFSPTTGGLIGTTTNDSTSAGNVGEYIESVIATGSATSLTGSTPKNITSISLTAGDWDVSGSVEYNGAGGVSVTYLAAGISTTTATLDQANGRTASLSMAAVVPGLSPGFGVPFGPVRLSLSGTTTVFMVSNQVFTVGTLAGFGLLRARRVR